MGQEAIKLEKQQKSRGRLAFAGVTIAFFIGSGFATGQEILQYFAAYGSGFILVIAVSMFIFLYTNLSFIHAGSAGGLEKSSDIFQYYCGQYIGRFYDIFVTLFVYLSYTVMCGGAGSAAAQQFGLPVWVGVCGLAVLTGLTVVGGLRGLVDVLGKLGPLVILSILTIGTVTVIRDFAQIKHGIQLISSGSVEVLRVGSNPVSAAVSYAGFVMMWFCTFMAELGRENPPRLVRSGMCIGGGAIAVTLTMMSLALLANLHEVVAVEIPSVALAAKISPAFATCFALITMLGSYTASVPLLWTASNRFAREKTPRFTFVTLLLAALGAVVALFLPYRKLVNIVYGISGYVGVLLIFFILARDARTFFTLHRQHTKS